MASSEGPGDRDINNPGRGQGHGAEKSRHKRKSQDERQEHASAGGVENRRLQTTGATDQVESAGSLAGAVAVEAQTQESTGGTEAMKRARAWTGDVAGENLMLQGAASSSALATATESTSTESTATGSTSTESTDEIIEPPRNSKVSKAKEKLRGALLDCIYAAFAYSKGPSDVKMLSEFAMALGVIGDNEAIPDEKELKTRVVRKLHQGQQLAKSGDEAGKTYSLEEVSRVLGNELETVLGACGAACGGADKLAPDGARVVIRCSTVEGLLNTCSEWFVEAMERSVGYDTSRILDAVTMAVAALKTLETNVFAKGKGQG